MEQAVFNHELAREIRDEVHTHLMGLEALGWLIRESGDSAEGLSSHIAEGIEELIELWIAKVDEIIDKAVERTESSPEVTLHRAREMLTAQSRIGLLATQCADFERILARLQEFPKSYGNLYPEARELFESLRAMKTEAQS